MIWTFKSHKPPKPTISGKHEVQDCQLTTHEVRFRKYVVESLIEEIEDMVYEARNEGKKPTGVIMDIKSYSYLRAYVDMEYDYESKQEPESFLGMDIYTVDTRVELLELQYSNRRKMAEHYDSR